MASSNSQSQQQQQQRLLVGGAPWEDMVQAWDPDSMLAVEASTPPLDAAAHRAPLLTVPAFADALKRALEQEQQHQSQQGGGQQQGGDGQGGLWGEEGDPFFGLDYFDGMGLDSPTCHPLGPAPAPDCGANGSSSNDNNDTTTTSSSSSTSRPGTATPDIFAAPGTAPLPAQQQQEAAAAEAEDNEEEIDLDLDDLHSLALPPTPPPALLQQLLPAQPLASAASAAAATGTTALVVRFPASAQPKSAKQYLGPLACDPALWASWGLAPHAWPAFHQQVNADPSAVPAHAAALLAAAEAAGIVVEEGEGMGVAAVLVLPAGAARPAAALDVLIVTSNSTTTTPLLDHLSTATDTNGLWTRYFHPHLPTPAAHAHAAAAARRGDAAAVYDFLCAYLFGFNFGVEPHWEEAALTNGLRVVLRPIVSGEPEARAAPAAGAEASPFLDRVLRGASLSSSSVPVAADGFPLLLAEEEEEEGVGVEGDLEAQLGMLFDAPAEPQPAPVVAAVVPVRGKQLSQLVSAKQQQGQQEQEGAGGLGPRRSGRARRAAGGAYAVDYCAGVEEEEDASESESEAEEEEEEEEEAGGDDNGLGYVYPGKPEPAGKALPDRGRHKCRVPGCAEEYRWPDYFCKVHGGGRCQYMWWDESIPRCTKFHQSRNSNGELLCGEHSRATGARYGEQSRRAKGGNNKGSSKGASASASAAAKAKKSKRVVKRKVW